MPKIGKNFADDLVAAGLAGAPIVWSIGGTHDDISGHGNLTPSQRKTLDAVIAAHKADDAASDKPASDKPKSKPRKRRAKSKIGSSQ